MTTSVVGPPMTPRLAEGTELIGPYHGSGYVEPKYIVGRADGQMIQLPHLLYRLAASLDGHRDTGELARVLSAELDRQITAEQITFLVDERLRPAGIAAPAPTQGGDGTAPNPPAKRPDPFLALRYRAPVCSARGSWLIAGIFQPMYWPVVVVAALGAFLALDVWLVVDGGLGRIVPAATELIYQPSLTLLVFGTLLASFVFHECGHAAACRYGGARPGTMGVGLYLVWPAFYTTVTDAYRLPRGGRLRTDLGGVYFNCVFMSGLAAAYLATGAGWLLVLLVVLHVETLTQFLPTVRFDGYYILSDLIGLPDLFMFLGPVVRSAVPGRRPDPKVAELRPWTRWVITVWVLAVIPCLLLLLALFLSQAPKVLPVLFGVLGDLAGAVGDAARAGETATATLGVLQMTFVVLPWLGAALIVWMLAGSIRGAVLTRRARRAAGSAPSAAPDARRPGPAAPAAPEDRPAGAAATGPSTARSGPATGSPTGWFLVALAPAVAVTGIAMAALGNRVTTAGEAAVAAAVGAAAGAPVPYAHASALAAVGARELAALDTLLAGVGQTGIADGLRAVLLVVALGGSLLLWPVARRVGLSAPVAAGAVVVGTVPAPVLLLHGTLDPAVLAAAWLTLAAATLGIRPVYTGVGAVALALGVLTAPPAAVAALALAAHRVLGGAGNRRGRARAAGVGGGIVLLALGGLLAAASTSGGPLDVLGAGPVPAPALVTMLVLGAAAVGVTWYRRDRFGPAATAAAVLLGWAVLDPSVRSSALTLAAPVLALLVAVAVDRFRPDPRRGSAQLAFAATVVLGVASSWPIVLAAFTPPPGDSRALAGWARAELGPATLRADPLTAVELVDAGVDPARLAPSSGTDPDSLVAVVERPGAAQADPTGPIRFVAPRGPGGGSVTVSGPPTEIDDTSARAARARFGAQLAGNPALRLTGGAQAALRAGDVDERVSATLSALTGTHRLAVADFPGVPGEPPTVPRRTAVVTGIDGAPAAAPGAAELVVRFLDGQLPPYRPARTEIDPVRGALIVHYTVPSTGSSR